MGCGEYEGRNRTSCFIKNNGLDLHRRRWRPSAAPAFGSATTTAEEEHK